MATVLALHGAALWALQMGLMRRAEDVAPAVAVIEVVVSRAAPAPQPAAAPPPPAQPLVQARTSPNPVSKPVRAAALPRPRPVFVQPTLLHDQPVQTTPPAPESAAQTALTQPAPDVSASATYSGSAQTQAESAAGLPASAQASVAPPAHAAYLSNPPPDYPPMSRLRHETGTVVLRVLFGADGRARDARVKQSSGHARLDDAALNTVRDRWRYRPDARADTPEATWRDVSIEFVLE